jgi:hypothetical protein
LRHLCDAVGNEPTEARTDSALWASSRADRSAVHRAVRQLGVVPVVSGGLHQARAASSCARQSNVDS